MSLFIVNMIKKFKGIDAMISKVFDALAGDIYCSIGDIYCSFFC